jgi:hypothetical protein
MLRGQLKIAQKEPEGRHYGAQRVAEQEPEANEFHAKMEKAGKEKKTYGKECQQGDPARERGEGS